MQADQKDIRFIIERQDGPDQPTYTEEFTVPYRPNMNVISALMEIRRNPVNANGDKTTPINWDMNCLEEVCGACSMIINGKPRQSCTALVDKLEQPIRLAPMKTFPVVRDLQVDRQRMFDALKKVKAWVPIDGTYDLGPGPRMPENKRQWGQRQIELHRTGRHLASPSLQLASDRRLPCGRTFGSAHGRRWPRTVRKRTKLCRSLSERHSAHDVYRCDEPSDDASLVQIVLR